MKSRINIEWEKGGDERRREREKEYEVWCGRKEKNVNFSSGDFENVMVMPLWIESSAH